MEREKIQRINELAQIKKLRALTGEETAERQALHQEYLAAFRQNMQDTLNRVRIQEADGSLTPLQKKADKPQ